MSGSSKHTVRVAMLTLALAAGGGSESPSVTESPCTRLCCTSHGLSNCPENKRARGGSRRARSTWTSRRLFFEQLASTDVLYAVRDGGLKYQLAAIERTTMPIRPELGRQLRALGYLQ